MTKEEFEKSEIKFGTVLYVDGKTKIYVLSKGIDCVHWYDEEEYYHTTSYEHLFFDMKDFIKKAYDYNWILKERGEINYPCDVIIDTYNEGYNNGYADALKIEKMPSDEMIIKIINLYNRFGCDKIDNNNKVVSIETIKEHLYDE